MLFELTIYLQPAFQGQPLLQFVQQPWNVIIRGPGGGEGAGAGTVRVRMEDPVPGVYPIGSLLFAATMTGVNVTGNPITFNWQNRYPFFGNPGPELFLSDVTTAGAHTVDQNGSFLVGAWPTLDVKAATPGETTMLLEGSPA